MPIRLLLILYASTAFAQTFSAKVVRISDDDTITVLRAGRQQRVRLNGIDCPERKQPFGTCARQFTGDLTHGKMVTIRVFDTDRYGRLVSDVSCPKSAIIPGAG